jgi:chemotaxis protein methyltransferase CheR
VTVFERANAERFRSVVAARLGLHFDDAKLDELSDTLRVRMLAVRATTVDAYIARMDAGELGALAERLTVGETYFFRYREQFQAFAEVALPAALRTGRRPIRILSAGCATGEEAYTLAIIAQGHASQIEVTAFDVNPAVVKRAKEARYSTWSLRDTPPPIRQRYFETDGGQYVLVPEVRDMVRFEDRNLLDDAPELWQPDAFDIVFCRNVIMYFGAEAMRAAVARIARSLRPDGFLFMGHAETLRGISRAFHLCHTHETFYYQRNGTHDPTRISPEATSLAALPGGTLPTPVALGLDTSWIDVIQRASERVAKLATERAGPRETTQPSPARADTQPILEMMREERFADALELLGTFSPTDPETQLLRAIVLTNGGRHREAERVCAELIAADELNAGAHYLLALCREHTGDGDGAREHDRIATYLDPAFAMPHVHMGLLERRAGHLDRAAAELARALELLASEDASRILLYGGGFSREALGLLCQNELRRCGGSA